MISVNDFKTGLTISVDNGIWKVIDFQHVKPGKGSAFVRSKLRNLRTGAIQEKTFRAGEKVEQAMIENRRMQYLYAATGATKSAPVETGYTLNVPLFVHEGDTLVINTSDGSYISRG